MKRLLLILIFILSFQSWSKADDISEFEIEGMSIGDSLLDYFSEEVIKDSINLNIYSYKKDKTFAQTALGTSTHNFDTYEVVMIEFKKNDKKYIIHGLTGKIVSKYEKDIKSCFKHQDNIFDELKELFKNQKIYQPIIKKHNADKSGRSEIRMAGFEFEGGDFVIVACYDYHTEMSYKSNFKVNLFSNELNSWLNKN